MELNYYFKLPSKIDIHNILTLETSIEEFAKNNKYLILDCSSHKSESDNIISFLLKAKKITENCNSTLFLTNVHYSLFESITENGYDSFITIFADNNEAEEEIFKREQPPYNFLIDREIEYYSHVSLNENFNEIQNNENEDQTIEADVIIYYNTRINSNETCLMFGEGYLCSDCMNNIKLEKYKNIISQQPINFFSYKKFWGAFLPDSQYLYKPNPTHINFYVNKAFHFKTPSGYYYLENPSYEKIITTACSAIHTIGEISGRKFPESHSLIVAEIPYLNTIMVLPVNNLDNSLKFRFKNYRSFKGDLLQTLGANLTASNIKECTTYKEKKKSFEKINSSWEAKIHIFTCNCGKLHVHKNNIPDK